MITRARTRENAANLAPGFVEEMERSYALDAHLRRQELEGELVGDPPNALWTREVIEGGRVGRDGLPFDRVVVAVDPPAGVGADACGIVAAGRRGGVVFVLRDASVRGLRPAQWAAQVVAAARDVGAGLIVAEANQGGEMVREMLVAAGAGDVARVKLVHARASKFDRAQPVSQTYAMGRVRHMGLFRELEDEMCCFGADAAGPSPDRVDALVWAVRELAQPRGRPGLAQL